MLVGRGQSMVGLPRSSKRSPYGRFLRDVDSLIQTSFFRLSVILARHFRTLAGTKAKAWMKALCCLWGVMEMLCRWRSPLYGSSLVPLSPLAGDYVRYFLQADGDSRDVREGHGLCACVAVARDF